MSGWLPANIAGGINTLASRAKEYAEAALSEDGNTDPQRHANYSLGGMGSNGFAKKNEGVFCFLTGAIWPVFTRMY